MEEFYKSDRHTAVCISIGGEALASICLIDEARRDAKGAVEALRGRGIKTAILTGDRPEIALDTAERLGVDEFYAELLPEDKLDIVERMRYGVNDAPALAASDIGIAMGGSRADMALESAEIILVKDELIQIPYIFRLSKKTVEIARQNILISIATKVTIGILGMLG